MGLFASGRSASDLVKSYFETALLGKALVLELNASHARTLQLTHRMHDTHGIAIPRIGISQQGNLASWGFDLQRDHNVKQRHVLLSAVHVRVTECARAHRTGKGRLDGSAWMELHKIRNVLRL
jgi:hypothetical protein